MIRIPGRLAMGLMVATVLVAACTPASSPTGSASIAGTYECNERPVNPDRPNEVWEVREDGTVTTTAQGGAVTIEGTWTAEGDSGTFTFDGPADEFTVVEGRLEFGPAGDPAWVCTPS